MMMAHSTFLQKGLNPPFFKDVRANFQVLCIFRPLRSNRFFAKYLESNLFRPAPNGGICAAGLNNSEEKKEKGEITGGVKRAEGSNCPKRSGPINSVYGVVLLRVAVNSCSVLQFRVCSSSYAFEGCCCCGCCCVAVTGRLTPPHPKHFDGRED